MVEPVVWLGKVGIRGPDIHLVGPGWGAQMLLLLLEFLVLIKEEALGRRRCL